MTSPNFTLLRTLTRQEAKDLGQQVSGTGKVVELRCDLTGTLLYRPAIAWRAGQVGHRTCCGIIRTAEPAPKPQKTLEAALYGLKNGFTTRLRSQQDTLAGLWRRAAPPSDLEGVRLDILLPDSGQVETFNLDEEQVALLNWWFALEAHPTIWVQPPKLTQTYQQNGQQSGHQAQEPATHPRLPVQYMTGGFGYRKTHVDVSTDPPTHLSQELVAWLLLRLHEHSCAMSETVPVPEDLMDDDLTPEQLATHAIRFLDWPAPANPNPSRFKYRRPDRQDAEIHTTAVNGEPSIISTDLDGTMLLLRRPRPVEPLPRGRYGPPKAWDLDDLEDVEMALPSHWEALPLWRT